MSVIIHVGAEGVRVPLRRQRVSTIARAVLRAEGVRDARLSITFVDNRRIASLNRRHLRHSGPTDVISFPIHEIAGRPQIVGDIYIAPAVARSNAAEHSASVQEELTRLIVHGVLHVLGFDHPEGRRARMGSAMWQRQEELVRRAMRRAARRGATRSTARSAA